MSRLERPLVAGAAYLPLVLAMTWPLARRLGTHVPAGMDDVWQNCWNFWWWARTLVERGQSPFFTDAMFFPFGASTVWHTHSPFNMLVGLPVTLVFGPTAAYGFCVLLALWLSALGAYLLARQCALDGRGAFVAGVVFAFFPQHVDETLEHLNLCATQFIPLTLALFLRVREGGRRRDALLLGVSAGLGVLADWHLGLLLLLALAPLAAWALVRGRERGRLARLCALAAGVALLVAAPAAWPLLRETAAALVTPHPFLRLRQERLDMGIDAAFLLRPHPAHPLFGGFTEAIYAARRAYPNAGFICYLGGVAPALGGVALARRAPGARGLALALAAALLLALGTHPWWDGRLLRGVTLPFVLVEQVPVLSGFRTANRVLVLAGLALALLAGMGWSALGRRSRGAYALAVALLLADYAWVPYPLQPAAPRPYAAWVRDHARPGAVLDVPWSADGRRVDNMRAQLTHGRPIAGGYLSVTPPRTVRDIWREPVLHRLSGFEPRLKHPRDDLARLRALGFAVIVLHKDAAGEPRPDPRSREPWRVRPETFAELRERLERELGGAVYEDGDASVFDLGPEASPPSR